MSGSKIVYYEIIELLKKSDLQLAIDKLETVASDEAIAFGGRLMRIEKDHQRGLSISEQYHAQCARLNKGILDFVRQQLQLEERAEKAELFQRVEDAFTRTLEQSFSHKNKLFIPDSAMQSKNSNKLISVLFLEQQLNQLYAIDEKLKAVREGWNYPSNMGGVLGQLADYVARLKEVLENSNNKAHTIYNKVIFLQKEQERAINQLAKGISNRQSLHFFQEVTIHEVLAATEDLKESISQQLSKSQRFSVN